MNQVSNIINLFSDFYYVSDIEFAKIQGEQLGRLINARHVNDDDHTTTRQITRQ